MKKVLFLIILLRLFSIGQSLSQNFSINKTEVSNFPKISLEINVKDINTLDKSNFKIKEQGTEIDFDLEKINTISDKNQKKNILILVERFHQKRINYFKNILNRSVSDFIHSGDKINIALFDVTRENGNKTIFPILKAYTDQKDSIKRAISQIAPKRDKYIQNSLGKNPKDVILDLYQAIFEGLEELDRKFENNKILIVFSAGRNNNAGTMKSSTIKQYAIRNNIQIYSIQYFINGYGNTNLIDVSKETSGESFSGRDAEKSSSRLIEFMNSAIEKNNGKNYRLTYRSSYLADGKSQKDIISVNDRDLTFFINTPDLSTVKAPVSSFKEDNNNQSLFEVLWNKYKYIILIVISLLILGFIILALLLSNKSNEHKDKGKPKSFQESRKKEISFTVPSLKENKSEDILGEMKKAGSLPVLVYKNKNKLIHFKIKKPTISIGKSNGSDLILEDEKAQDTHAFIYFTDKKYRIINANKNSITFVKGKILKEEVILKHGTRITIGKSEIIFTI